MVDEAAAEAESLDLRSHPAFRAGFTMAYEATRKSLGHQLHEQIPRFVMGVMAMIDAENPPDPTVYMGASPGAMAASAEVAAYLAGVEGIVDANRFEQSELWKRFHKERGIPWEENLSGFGVTVGKVGDMPVSISINTAKIDGRKILFVEDTSQVVDFRMIDAWLVRNLPEAATNRANAQNAHYVLTPYRPKAANLPATEVATDVPKMSGGSKLAAVLMARVTGDRDLSVTEAAALLGIGRPALSNVLNGNAGLSIPLALAIERHLGASARDLLILQLDEQIAAARSQAPGASIEPSSGCVFCDLGAQHPDGVSCAKAGLM